MLFKKYRKFPEDNTANERKCIGEFLSKLNCFTCPSCNAKTYSVESYAKCCNCGILLNDSQPSINNISYGGDYMDKKYYTEIRIIHKNKEEKVEYESKLDKALKSKGYTSRTEFIREKIRELVNN